MLASSTYEFEAVVIANKSSLTAGIKLAVNGPSGATVIATVEGMVTGTTFGSSALNALATLEATAFAAVAATDCLVVVKGIMVVSSTPGTLQIQHAAVTSQTSRIQVNSCLKLRKVA